MRNRTLTALLIAGFSLWLTVSAGASTPVYLGQNWSSADRQWFYTTPQGSQLIQYSWFEALERPDTQERFVADSLARFDYLPNDVSQSNPDGLPVGFVRDREGQESWLGMTCAACHTGQIDYKGQTLQIDGAPANADLYGFLAELAQALARTDSDSAKFERFAARVIGATAGSPAKTRLRQDLDHFSSKFTTFVQNSTPDSPWGPARTDAFGMIFNRVSSLDLGISANSRKPNAPVSYPHLWDTSWHDRVQWNLSAPNRLVAERLGRNVGEALGVFARINLEKPRGLRRYYPSSVKRSNLIALEERISRLRSPRWPEPILGSIDPLKAAQGEILYRQYCVSCHPVIDRDRPNEKITVYQSPVSEVGTDPVMATAPLTRDAATGSLKGALQSIWYGRPLKEREPVLDLVRNAVIGAILSPIPDAKADRILRQPPADDRSALNSALYLGILRRSPKTAAEVTADKELRSGIKSFASESSTAGKVYYKARPLDGIWATAPYLHNGSVPSLYQLLLPVERRDSTFYVGSREFDPKNVGFVSSPFNGGFKFDTSLPGNHNSGHLYGTDLSDDERWQLVEYLKTLYKKPPPPGTTLPTVSNSIPTAFDITAPFGSEILEVTIGVIFIYILISTTCTAVREGIEAWLKTRAAYLEYGIRELLHDKRAESIAKSFFEHPLIYGLYSGEYTSPTSEKRPWALSRGKNLPSYIPSRNFAVTLMDIAARGPATDVVSSDPSSAVVTLDSIRTNLLNIGNPWVQRVMLTAIDAAQGDINKAQANIEAWYNSGMERVSGWYKRSTQWIIFVIGLIVAVGLNVNTITIADFLYRNDGARAALVARAEAAANAEAGATTGAPAASNASPSSNFKKALNDLNSLNLPIGWDAGWGAPRRKSDPGYQSGPWNIVFAPILGWLLTAFAATLGAPFWFDVLNKVMVFRSTVKPQEKSPEEASAARQPAAPRTIEGTDSGAGPVGGDAGSAGAGTTPPQPSEDVPSPPDDESGVDGCDVAVEEETSDEDLPAAEGGVA